MKLLLPFWVQLFISNMFSTCSWGNQALPVRHWLVFRCCSSAQCQCLWNCLKTLTVNFLDVPTGSWKTMLFRRWICQGLTHHSALLPMAAGIRTLTSDCTRKKHHCLSLKKRKISVTTFIAFDSSFPQGPTTSGEVQCQSREQGLAPQQSPLMSFWGLHLRKDRSCCICSTEEISPHGEFVNQQLSLNLCPCIVALLWFLFSS